MGFLYIIKRKGLTKIGITVDIRRRMNELKPDKVFQVVKLRRERELEKKLHRQFADKRLQGSEYFFLNWVERQRACHLARRSGKKVRFPYRAPVKTRRVSPVVALELCVLGLAVGVAAVVITQSQPPNGQPQQQEPVSFTDSTQRFVSV